MARSTLRLTKNVSSPPKLLMTTTEPSTKPLPVTTSSTCTSLTSVPGCTAVIASGPRGLGSSVAVAVTVGVAVGVAVSPCAAAMGAREAINAMTRLTPSKIIAFLELR